MRYSNSAPTTPASAYEWVKAFFKKWLIITVKQLSNENTLEVQCIYVITKQPLHGQVKSVKLKLTTVRVNITNSKVRFRVIDFTCNIV